MPNTIITPNTLRIIFLATLGQDVVSLIAPLPQQLLAEAQTRGVNLAIQYGTLGIAQTAVNQAIDPLCPTRLIMQSIKSLATASNPGDTTINEIMALKWVDFLMKRKDKIVRLRNTIKYYLSQR